MRGPSRHSRSAPAYVAAAGLTCVVAAVVARGTFQAPAAAADNPPTHALDADVDTLEAQLSGIDFLPDRDRLDDVAPNNPTTALIDICQDTGARAGQRLRALRSLAQYPSPRARTALVDAIGRYRDAEKGMDLLYLRAALEALAQVGGDDTWLIVIEFFDHRSPDIRAAAVRAVGDLGDPSATAELFRRLDLEKVPFVRAAIERALRDLQRRQP